MNEGIRRRRIIACAALVCGLWPALAGAASDVFTIEQFNEVYAKRIGLTSTIEGRVAFIAGKDRLKFKNCQIPFRIAEGASPAFRKTPPNVEVTGQVVRDDRADGNDGKLIFLVQSLRELPSDYDTFLRKRREIRGENATAAKAWYALADWGLKRGEYYRDPELIGESNAARLRGFEIERRHLEPDDVEGRAELAARIQDGSLPVPDALRMELIHEGFVLRKTAMAKSEHPDWEQLAGAIAEGLPTDGDSAADATSRLRAEYLARPIETYAKASANKRPKLHRIFWGEVKLQAILEKAEADGSNGFEIAEAIDRNVSEYHGRAEELRDKALALRAKSVEKLSRTEVIALRQQYRDRNQPLQGENAVESWLTLQRKRLEPGDTEGLMFLADQYTAMLDRPEMTARLLIDAALQRPDSKALSARLTDLGFVFKQGRWMSTEESKAIPEGKMEKALREGRVEQGMTAAQVLKSLGSPQTTTRIATSGQVGEVWTYGQAGSSRLVIYLVKRTSQTEPRVVGIDDL